MALSMRAVFAIASLAVMPLRGEDPLRIVTESLPDAVVGHEYSQILTAAGGCVGPATPLPQFRVVSGQLPTGLSIEMPSTAGSLITGLPQSAGVFPFTLEVVDSCGNSAKSNLAIRVVKGRIPPRRRVRMGPNVGAGQDAGETETGKSSP